jgi:hypothetical protein
MADEKKPEDKKTTDAEKKAAEERAAAEGLAPRPDPVGERNYAMSEPVVRPEGEGTPGAMRHVAPPVSPVKAEEPKPDDVVKKIDTPVKVAPVKPASPPIKK